MYKLLLLCFACMLEAQQSCKLSFSNTPLLKDGKIVFSIKSESDKTIKIPFDFSSYRITPQDIQVFSSIKESYEDVGYSFEEATCLTVKECYGKMIRLKKGNSKSYSIKIVPGMISKVFERQGRYRFKLRFDTYLFSGCSPHISNWLYYENDTTKIR